MKLIQFAVASIVDANTGHGMELTRERQYRALAAQGSLSVLTGQLAYYLHRAGRGLEVARRWLQKRRAEKHNLRLLGRLNDHLLDDIGLTRADVMAAESGQIDVAELGLRRANKYADKPANPHRSIATGSVIHCGDASNEAIFATAKCA